MYPNLPAKTRDYQDLKVRTFRLVYADALERSCNVYFETVADAFGVQGLSYWYDRFGIGRETGLGISEACGFLPSATTTMRSAHIALWAIKHRRSLSVPGSRPSQNRTILTLPLD